MDKKPCKECPWTKDDSHSKSWPGYVKTIEGIGKIVWKREENHLNNTTTKPLNQNKMTAVQELFSELKIMHPQLFDVYTTEGKEFINHFHKYLAVEKQQIKDAYRFGISDEYVIGSQRYYNETFKQQEI